MKKKLLVIFIFLMIAYPIHITVGLPQNYENVDIEIYNLDIISIINQIDESSHLSS